MKLSIDQGIDPKIWQQLTDWSARVFPDEGREIDQAEPRWHILAISDDDIPVAHLAFDRFDILVDGKPTCVTGVGSIMVRPEFQGQGVPGELFEKLHDEAGQYTGTDLFALFCPERLITYYQRHGYTTFDGTVNIPGVTEHRFYLMTHGENITGNRIDLTGRPW